MSLANKNFPSMLPNICSKTAQFLFLESSQEEGSREDECDTLTKVFLTSICGVCIN